MEAMRHEMPSDAFSKRKKSTLSIDDSYVGLMRQNETFLPNFKDSNEMSPRPGACVRVCRAARNMWCSTKVPS